VNPERGVEIAQQSNLKIIFGSAAGAGCVIWSITSFSSLEMLEKKSEITASRRDAASSSWSRVR